MLFLTRTCKLVLLSAVAASSIGVSSAAMAQEPNESHFRGHLDVGLAFDVHGDFGASLDFRAGHAVHIEPNLHLVASWFLRALVVPSNSDEHNRTTMPFGLALGLEWRTSANFAFGLVALGGLNAGATQAAKLGVGPYVDATLEAMVSLGENAWFTIGPSWALVYGTFASRPSNVVSIDVGIGWR